MKTISNLLLAGMTAVCFAQTVPNLPIPMGAGTAEVWNDSLYFFGGSNTWGGRDQLYPRVYKFDGAAWSYQDSIPDNNVWDIESVLVGDAVYLLGGWRSGASLLRKYDLSNRRWTYLAPSPNTATWGITAEYLDGFIYLFNANGNVFAYDVANNIWRAKTSNATPGYSALSSVVNQDEIYITGFYDSGFYKYTPAADKWTALANTPYPVAACAMGIINGWIYCVGGSEQGNNSNTHRTILAYDIGANSWSVDRFQIDGRRTWMAAVTYQDGLYVLGGFDSSGVAVDDIEEIIPLGPLTGVKEKDLLPSGFSLSQNYPNPFSPLGRETFGNPSTTIPYSVAQPGQVRLTIFNMLGQKVRTVVSIHESAGAFRLSWDGRDDAGRILASGIYFYRLTAADFQSTRRMILKK